MEMCMIGEAKLQCQTRISQDKRTKGGGDELASVPAELHEEVGRKARKPRDFDGLCFALSGCAVVVVDMSRALPLTDAGCQGDARQNTLILQHKSILRGRSSSTSGALSNTEPNCIPVGLTRCEPDCSACKGQA